MANFLKMYGKQCVAAGHLLEKIPSAQYTTAEKVTEALEIAREVRDAMNFVVATLAPYAPDELSTDERVRIVHEDVQALKALVRIATENVAAGKGGMFAGVIAGLLPLARVNEVLNGRNRERKAE